MQRENHAMVQPENLPANPKQWLEIEAQQRLEAAQWALQEGDSALLWGLFEAHLSLRPQPLSPHSLHTYRMGLLHYLRYTEETQVDRFGLPPLQLYVDWLHEQGLAHLTIRTRATAAGHFIRALQWSGISQPHVSRPHRFPESRDEQRHRRPYSNSEIAKLLGRADVEERLILLLGLETGLKAGEMSALRYGDVQLDSKPPHLMVKKHTGPGAVIEIPSALQSALRAWFAGRPFTPTSSVLPGKRGEYMEDKIRGLCQRTEVEYSGAAVEGLRLTAGARLYRSTNSLEALMIFLRISHRRNVAQYVAAAEGLSKTQETVSAVKVVQP